MSRESIFPSSSTVLLLKKFICSCNRLRNIFLGVLFLLKVANEVPKQGFTSFHGGSFICFFVKLSGMDNSVHSDKKRAKYWQRRLMRLDLFADIIELISFSNTEFVLLISYGKILDFNSYILSVIVAKLASRRMFSIEVVLNA